uniref:Uncharacterized protein n=1 Tax=Klebsiella pneumoniae TaxID=573 RepID=A0A8B0SVY2_KLEPN|nr:hypothetical protein [Klebsiella pneumoniae]
MANSPIFNVENWYYYLAMVNKVFSVHIFLSTSMNDVSDRYFKNLTVK